MLAVSYWVMKAWWITERKQVEEAGEARERYLAALVEVERKLLTLMVTETTTKRY